MYTLQSLFNLGYSFEPVKQVINRTDVIMIVLSQNCLRSQSNLCKNVYFDLDHRHLRV